MTDEKFDMVCHFDELVPLEKGEQGDDAPWLMAGWASTPDLDSQGERVVQHGLEVDQHLKNGWINWNHKSDQIIGTPRVCEVRQRHGKPSLYTEFELLKSIPRAKNVWELANALANSGTGRTLGLSLEGKKLQVSKTGTIQKARLLNIAVCPNPVNPETSVQALVKGFSGEDVDQELFDPPEIRETELADRVESVVAQAMTKALGSGFDVGGTSQVGGDAVKKEGYDLTPKHLTVIEKSDPIRTMSLGPGVDTIRDALMRVHDSRGGLVKSEAALLLFLDPKLDVGLQDCFKVLGVGE